MRILVTGGCGFIGSNFIKHMVTKYPQYNIINYDKLTYAGNRENNVECEFYNNYHFVKGDINDYDKVYDTIKTLKPKLIYFLAISGVIEILFSVSRFSLTEPILFIISVLL